MPIRYTCQKCGLSLTVETECQNRDCPKCKVPMDSMAVAEVGSVKVARTVRGGTNTGLLTGGLGTGGLGTGGLLSATSTANRQKIQMELLAREAEIAELRKEHERVLAELETLRTKTEECYEVILQWQAYAEARDEEIKALKAQVESLGGTPPAAAP